MATVEKTIKRVKIQGAKPPAADLGGPPPSENPLSFTLTELWGAMARSSCLNYIDPRCVTHESMCCKLMLSRHLDEKSDQFCLLGTTKNLKDFSRNHLTGVLGGGLAYLKMISEGYAWFDHFENVGFKTKSKSRKAPDFVFSSSKMYELAVVESKATNSSSAKQFKRTVARGYKDQVVPHLGDTLGCSKVTRGFAIGSWAFSGQNAQLYVDYTELDPSSYSGGTPGSTVDPVIPTSEERTIGAVRVREGNYINALRLMFGEAIVDQLTNSQQFGLQGRILTCWWLGRRWVLGAEVFPDLSFGRAQLGSGAIFALEFSVMEAVLAHFLTRAPNALLNLEPMPVGLSKDAAGLHGAIYPDGFALVPYDAIDRTSLEPFAQTEAGRLEENEQTAVAATGQELLTEYENAEMFWTGMRPAKFEVLQLIRLEYRSKD